MGLELPERWDVMKVIAREERKEREEAAGWRMPLGGWHSSREGAGRERGTIIVREETGRRTAAQTLSARGRFNHFVHPTHLQ